MRTVFQPLMIPLLIALAGPAAAQEAEDAADDPTADLSMGTPVSEDGPQEGQPYIREEFGDWALRCLRAAEGQPDPCQLYQLLLEADGNAVADDGCTGCVEDPGYTCVFGHDCTLFIIQF